MQRNVLLALAAAIAAGTVFAKPLVKDGEKIAFIGDSITEFGNWPAGYVNMVVKGLELSGVKVGKIAVGHSAETSENMVRRFAKDVVAAKPDWVTISCGVNDVERMCVKGKKEVDYGKFEKNVRGMLDMAKAAGIRPVLLTPTIRWEDKPDSEQNQQILKLGAFMREEAKARQIPVADLNALMRETMKTTPLNGKYRLTRDGVHMNFAGNAMMAKGVLKAFGVETTPAIESAWRDLPDGRCYYQWFTWSEAQRLEAAKKPGEDRKHCAERLVREAVAAGRVPEPPKPGVAPKDESALKPEIVFLGDRVVAWGNDQDCGWVRMTRKGLELAEGRHVVAQTKAWWLRDETEAVMAKAEEFAAAKPKRAVLMLGSREMRPKYSKPEVAVANLARAKERILRLIDLFTAAKAETVVLGHPVMTDKPGETDNQNVAEWNAWLKGECAKRGAKFVDLYALMSEELKAREGKVEAEPFGDSWFISGWYHMIPNFRGHRLIARNVLKAFGVETTDALERSWADAGGAIQPQLGFSLNEWDAFDGKAKAQKMSVEQYCGQLLKMTLKDK